MKKLDKASFGEPKFIKFPALQPQLTQLQLEPHYI